MPKTTRRNSKAAKGGGTIRERKDGLWEARYTVGRDPGTGKQIQKSLYAGSQEEVRKLLTQATAAVDSGSYVEPQKLSVGAWLDIWTRDYIGNIKPSTHRAYVDNIALHIKPALGAVYLQKLSTQTLQRFYNDLAESGRVIQRGQKKVASSGLSAKTIRNIHAILHKALRQAMLLSYIKTNPTEACTLPRVEKKEMKILQGDEIPAFIKAAESHRHGTIYVVALFTGLRRGEVLGLTWECIDFSGKTILVSKQLQRQQKGTQKRTGLNKQDDSQHRSVLRLVPLKNDKRRRITPPDTVFSLLRQQKHKQEEMRLKAGKAWAESGLVFTNEIGNPLDGDGVYQAYKTFLVRNGFSDIRLHDLRHTAATLMLQNGIGIKTVQETLGHHSSSFTLDVYGHVTEEMHRDSANKMEAFIKSIETK